MNNKRLDDLVRFYSILDTLERDIGAAKTLADCSGRMDWPKRGVYFFREPREPVLIREQAYESFASAHTH